MIGALDTNIDDCINAFAGIFNDTFMETPKIPFFTPTVTDRGLLQYDIESLRERIKKVIQCAGFEPHAK
jgi:hypothetical protein